MSERRPTFAEMFLLKPGEKKDQQKDQADLKPDRDQSARVTQSLDHTELSSQSLAPVDPSSQRAKVSKSLDPTDLSSKGSKITQTLEKGYFLPNWIQDNLIPTLELTEQSLLLRIVRLTLGFHRQVTDSVSLAKLAEKCNLSIPSVKRGVKSLQNRGLIKIHSDLSRNGQGGNRYELLINSLDLTDPSSQRSKLTESHIKDLDLDPKNHKSPQEIETIYQDLTGNIWTKSDSTTYKKISHLSVMEFTQLIKSTLEKAHQKPASLAYFVKAYQNPTQANPANKSAIKAKIAAIVQRKQEAHVGTRYTIADLTYDVKAECVREGIVFDNELFNEVLEKR